MLRRVVERAGGTVGAVRARLTVDRRAVRTVGAALLLTPVLASCVGSVSVNRFDEEVQARGGGIGEELPLDAVDAVAAELAVDPVELVDVNISAGLVTMQVRVPGTDQVDTWWYGTSGRYGGQGLRGPEPYEVTVSQAPLEQRAFPADQAGLDHLDEMVDTAFRELALEGAYATAVHVTRFTPEAPPVAVLTVTNDRQTFDLRFSPDGSLQEVQQR